MKLKYFLPQFRKEIKCESTLTLICMVYLSCDHKKIPNFYKNHYLRDTLGVLQLPTINNVYMALYTIGELGIKLEQSTFYLINDELNSKNINDFTYEDATHSAVFCAGEKIVLDYIERANNYDNRLVASENSNYLYSQPTNSLIEDINNNGFAIVEKFLSCEALEEMKFSLEVIADREVKSKQAYMYGSKQSNQRVYNLLSKGKCFRDFLECSFLELLMDRVFSRDTFHEKYGLSSIAAHIIPPGGEAMIMHIDNAVPEPLPPWRIRFIVIICLTDMTFENGAPGVLPCSHLRLKKPSTEEGLAAVNDEQVLVAPAGSLIMWDGALWHRSRSNLTQTNRVGVIVSYGASFFKEICGEEEHLIVVPKNLQEQLSPRLRSLIGLDRGVKAGAMYFEKD